jgi:hypothetical protein
VGQFTLSEGDLMKRGLPDTFGPRARCRIPGDGRGDHRRTLGVRRDTVVRVAPRGLQEDLARRDAHRRRRHVSDAAGDVGTVKKGNELTIGWHQTDVFHGTMDDLQIDFG